MKWKSILVLALWSLVFGRMSAASPQSPKPNILFIMTDQLKATALGSYGDEVVRSPHLDRLAREGVVFEHAYVQSPLCIPSRASLLTGRYPQSHGQFHERVAINKDEIYISNILRESGYWVGALGKMHHVPASQKRGFTDLYDVTPLDQVTYPDETPQSLRAKHLKNVQGTNNSWIAGVSGLSTQEHPTWQLTSKALRVFEERAAQRDRPFLLWLSYTEPHHPCLPSPEYAAMYDPAEMKLPPNFTEPMYYADWHLGMMQRYLRQQFDDDKNAIRTFIARYYGEISMVDTNIGRVLGSLDQLDLAKDTIIVFTADHGDFAGEHGAIMKGDVYDPLTRVPLIMRFPAASRGGKKLAQLVEQIDIMPTLLEAAGILVPGPVHGKSLLSLIDGRTSRHKDHVFSMIQTNEMKFGRFLIRSEQWAYIEDALMDRELLFDMKEDPWQIHNLALTPAYEDILNEHRAALRSYFEGPYVPPDPKFLPRRMQTR